MKKKKIQEFNGKNAQEILDEKQVRYLLKHGDDSEYYQNSRKKHQEEPREILEFE